VFKDLLLGKRKQSAPASTKPMEEDSGDGVNEEFPLWSTIIVVAIVVTTLIGLFVFVGSLPTIHERQKAEAVRNGTLSR
jgi:hypothetical protein